MRWWLPSGLPVIREPRPRRSTGTPFGDSVTVSLLHDASAQFPDFYRVFVLGQFSYIDQLLSTFHSRCRGPSGSFGGD